MRTCTRSLSWLTIHRPYPFSAAAGGRTRPVSGALIRPVSETSQARKRGSSQARRIALAAAVAHAVRGQLVDRQQKVLAPLLAEARVDGQLGEERAHGRQRVRVERDLVHVGRRRVELALEHAGGEGLAAVLRAVALAAAGRHQRVRPAGVVDDRRVEGLDVVGAHQREARRVGERQVQQRLVVVALGDLVGRAAGPDRLADAAHALTLGEAVADEVVPGGDDRAGVLADLLDVGEADPVGQVAELLAKQGDLASADEHQGRLSRRDPVAQERRRRGDELALALVHEGDVAEGIVFARRRAVAGHLADHWSFRSALAQGNRLVPFGLATLAGSVSPRGRFHLGSAPVRSGSDRNGWITESITAIPRRSG